MPPSPLPENPSESRQHTRACAYGPVSRPARFLAPPAPRDSSWGHFLAPEAARGPGRKAGEIRTPHTECQRAACTRSVAPCGPSWASRTGDSVLSPPGESAPLWRALVQSGGHSRWFPGATADLKTGGVYANRVRAAVSQCQGLGAPGGRGHRCHTAPFSTSTVCASFAPFSVLSALVALRRRSRNVTATP